MSAVVYINYPRKEGSWFDLDFYLKTHMAIVDKHWGPLGMKGWTVVQFEENDPSGMHVQAMTFWESHKHFEHAIAANIPEVMEDVKNYTDVGIVRWYAKVVKQG